jgi:DNA-binding response OmpR family regulator
MRVSTEGIPSASVLTIGPLRIDLDAYEVYVSGVPVVLRPREFRVLAALAGRPGIVFSRGRLLRMAWVYPEDVTDIRVVDSCVSRLRSKLCEVLGDCNPIAAVHDAGYKLKRDLGLGERR